MRKGMSAVTATGRATVPCLTFDTRGSGTGSGVGSSGRSLGSGRGGSRGGGPPHSGTRSPLDSGTRSPLNSGGRSPLGGTLSARSAFAQKSRANPFGAPLPSPNSQRRPERQPNSFHRSAAHASESHVDEAEDARDGAGIDARDGAAHVEGFTLHSGKSLGPLCVLAQTRAVLGDSEGAPVEQLQHLQFEVVAVAQLRG